MKLQEIAQQNETLHLVFLAGATSLLFRYVASVNRALV